MSQIPAIIVRFCHYSGERSLPLRSVEYATAFALADGFGPIRHAAEARARGFYGDWSHFRDSSDEALEKVAAYLAAVERAGSLSGNQIAPLEAHEVQY